MAAGAVDALTIEQRVAAATPAANVYLEAGPGTGKTTVSAHRYGAHRFGPAGRHDARAVIAVSFTRAATRNLRRRVQRLWGPSALTWPNRIVTLDTIMIELLESILTTGLLQWPNQDEIWPDGNVVLDVHDSWAVFGGSTWNRTAYRLDILEGRVRLRTGFVEKSRSAIPVTVSAPRLLEGICTHQDVRTVLEQAIEDPSVAEHVGFRLSQSIRSLIVDEVFDANDLDIAVIEAAVTAGVAVTLVGDPWQALYVFRGARPDAVPGLLERTSIPTLALTRSFRWQDDGQARLATNLREGHGAVLERVNAPESLADVSVVLCLWWKPLWELGAGVLPLAFHSFKGGYEEAAATLLLNHLTRSMLDMDATYLNDALTALAIQDREVPRQLEPALQDVAALLQVGGKAAVESAYDQLIRVVATVSPRQLRARHAAHTARLALVQQRIKHPGRVVPGLTTHQAKGGEWEYVGLRLGEIERVALEGGLSKDEDLHRKLYVACTRAHRRTVEVIAPPRPTKAKKARAKPKA